MLANTCIGRIALAVCALGALAPAACGGGPVDPLIPTLTGSWSVATPGIEENGETVSGTFILKESPTGQITGSGSLKVPGDPLRSFTVLRGTHTDPDVYIIFRTSDQWTHQFLGRMSPDGKEIQGALGMIPGVLTRQ